MIFNFRLEQKDEEEIFNPLPCHACSASEESTVFHRPKEGKYPMAIGYEERKIARSSTTKNMAVLLRNARTGLFYAGYHAWRLYPEQGFDFQSFERAKDWVSTTQLENVEVIQVPGGEGLDMDRQEIHRRFEG